MAADDTERLALEVTTNVGDAIDDLGDLADAVDKVEGSDPTITPKVDTGTGDADLDALFEKVKHPPTLDVQVDDSALKSARDKVADAGDSGRRFGAQFGRDVGSAFSEQTAGLGGDLTDALATAFESFGVTAPLAGSLVAALGIGTVVVSAAQGLWSLLNKSSEEYKKTLADALSIQQALAAGELQAAAKKTAESLAGIAPTLKALGITTEDASSFVLGASDSLGDLTTSADDNAASIAAINKIMEANGSTYNEAVKQYKDARDKVAELNKANRESKGTLADQQDAQLAATLATIKATGATEDGTKALLDQARQYAPLRSEILKHVAALNGIPPAKVTEILTDLDPNDVDQVQQQLDDLTRDRQVVIKMQAQIDAALAALIKSGFTDWRSWLVGQSAGTSTRGAGTTIVQVPPTLNPAAVVNAVTGGRARSGGLARGRPVGGG